MSGKIKFLVTDRKDRVLANLDMSRDVFTTNMTVGELIELIHSKVEKLSKMDINRVRLTIGNADGKYDPKGKALADKGQKVEDFFTKEEYNSN